MYQNPVETFQQPIAETNTGPIVGRTSLDQIIKGTEKPKVSISTNPYGVSDSLKFSDFDTEMTNFNNKFKKEKIEREDVNARSNMDDDSGDEAKFNPGELLRYAPAAMNAFILNGKASILEIYIS